MQRIAALVLVAGGILILSWVVAPAAPAVKATPAPILTPTEFQQASAPVLADMQAQVERMRERLSATPPYPTPSRDPFRFGTRADPAKPAPAAAAPVAPPAAPPPPPPLPRLIAIVSQTTETGSIRTALVAGAEGMKTLKVGDTIGAFTIRAIDATGVDLVDAAGLVHRIR
jgi:hypothetical protein